MSAHFTTSKNPSWNFTTTRRIFEFTRADVGNTYYNTHKASLERVNQTKLNSESSIGIIPEHRLYCQGLNVLFVWRRSYVAHPRNPTGRVVRKVSNEKELLMTIQYKFPKFSVQAIQLENYTMAEQLYTIGKYTHKLPTG